MAVKKSRGLFDSLQYKEGKAMNLTKLYLYVIL